MIRSAILASLTFTLYALPLHAQSDAFVVYQGGNGPGAGKHIVLVSGDEEYRSEEMLPQLGKILAKHHGFKCTVLFAVDPKDGTINPNVNNNIPGLENLRTADLLILFTRFRNLPDDQLKHIVDYVESGKPIIGLRTATHAFSLKGGSQYAKYHWQSKTWDGGFGRQVLGETWVSHHGKHGSQSTRGITAPGMDKHPIVHGIKDGDIWGPTDVYGVKLPLPGDSKPIVLGQVLQGMKPDDKPVAGKQNDPMMPIAWTRSYTGAQGKTARVFTSTIASSQDFQSEGLRRLMVNATYWALGMEDALLTPRTVEVVSYRPGLIFKRRLRPSVYTIAETGPAKVDLVGPYTASPFRVNGFAKGVRPAELREP